MSLLLDALKKAAKDKEQAAERNDGANAAPSVAESREENGVSGDEIELVLDEAAEVEVAQEAEQGAVEQEDATMQGMSHANTTAPEPEPEIVRERTSTVSDEALQMLVFKTNREHRRKQILIWSSVSIISVIILVLGGVYFYTEMVGGIEDMERKHRIALQKANAEKVDREPAMVLSGTRAEGKATDVEPGIQTAEVSKAEVSVETRKSVSAVQQSARETSSSISIVREEKTDPIGAMLSRAWRSYNDNDYEGARVLYSDVLRRESTNRDALLGRAAVAMKQGDVVVARASYASLLHLDPNDTLAIAGMSQLSKREYDGMSESKLKLLLRQQPGDAHLNFALGNISAQQSRWPEAQSYYFDAWQAESDNADFAFNLAVSLEHIGKQDQAVRFYRDSVRLAANGDHNFPLQTAKDRLAKLSQ